MNLLIIKKIVTVDYYIKTYIDYIITVASNFVNMSER